MNIDAVEKELEKIAKPGEQAEAEPEQERYNELPTGRSFQLDEIILELESIGNKYIEEHWHKDLKFSESEIDLHSEMLAYTLERIFPLEHLKNTPEYILMAQTSLMTAKFYRKFKELEQKGELNK